MAVRVDRLVRQLINLEVHLLACQARLLAATDSEALHNLRTGVRRLRSIVRPLRGLPGIEQLEQAAADVGRLTTPLRDREVLAAYLLAHGQTAAARRRTLQLSEDYRCVATSAELGKLFMVLDATPRFMRATQHLHLLRGLRRRVELRLAKQWKALDRALHDPNHDRHRLRLLVKRVRYSAEAYPDLEPLPPRVMARLTACQSALGDWHDGWQWLLQAEREPDLMPCVENWRQTMAMAEKRADRELRRFSETRVEGRPVWRRVWRK